MNGRFRNRREAGLALAGRLAPLHLQNPIVLGLPRGGVPVAFEVARSLHVPLDVFVVRKLGVPGQEELAMGAIASGGTIVLNDEVVQLLRLPAAAIREAERREAAELDRRERLYRGERRTPDLAGMTVVLVDDGVATGSTMLAAIAAIRRQAPSRIVVGVPVAAADVARTLRESADEVVCVNEVRNLEGVSLWYDDFTQTSDAEVRALLDEAAAANGGAQAVSGTLDRTRNVYEVRIPIGDGQLGADLTVPEGAGGLVIFAHGSGSSRSSPRNRAVAGTLEDGGLATLLLDLLTEREEQIDQRTRHLRFDIELLTRRLVAATDWAMEQSLLASLPIGYFGASTGAAAALEAAAARPARVRAVVSRGGRPDLASASLHAVRCPTLLIVGGLDTEVIGLNRTALAGLHCEKALEIVPGATHLFEEDGALDRVARLALGWFDRHLSGNDPE